MKVVCLASSKGGVGKSALGCNLGVALSKGRRVVLLDVDNSHGSTTNLGIRGADHRNDDGRGLAEALLRGVAIPTVSTRWVTPWDADGVVFERENLRLAVGGEEICAVSDALVRGELSVERMFAQVRQLDADVVIIDCPPGDRRMQAAALAVADEVLVPVEYDMNSILGLVKLVKVIVEAKELNPNLRLLGVMVYRLPAGAPAQRREARLNMEQALNTAAPVLETIVRASVEYGRAQNLGLVASEYSEFLRYTEGVSAAKSVSALAWDFDQLLDEVLNKWA